MAKKGKYRKLKRAAVIFVFILAAFAIYVEIANRNSKHMSYRQKVLKAVYPAFMWFNKLVGKNRTELANESRKPVVSFYSLKSVLNNGDTLDFANLKGRKVMLVNTASDCGYTNQYADLQKLFDQKKDHLVILAFPANDFKEQEKGTDTEIAQFCKINFGINFPLMKKSTVIKSAEQNPVFRWLTDPLQNGWNNQAPSWNFSKYLVNEEGTLAKYFGPAVSPLDNDVLKAVDAK
jgi:glutathione peroxidase